MTTRTHSITRTPTTAQPALGFAFTPSRSNADYALAAGLVYDPVDGFNRPVTPAGPVKDTRADTRRADLHHTFQAAINCLPTVYDIDPEAASLVRQADAALRKLLAVVDGGGA